MSDWFQPYRYLDADLRGRRPFDSLEALALDIHGWRRGRGCRSVVCADHQDAWDNPEGRRATVRVEIKAVAGGAVVDARTVLTAGESAETLRAELLSRHAADRALRPLALRTHQPIAEALVLAPRTLEDA